MVQILAGPPRSQTRLAAGDRSRVPRPRAFLMAAAMSALTAGRYRPITCGRSIEGRTSRGRTDQLSGIY